MMSHMRVALVGRTCADNTNLGIDYLSAALSAAGMAHECLPLNDSASLEAVGAALLAAAPRMIGLSLPDGGSAYLPLALGQWLHRRGYEGHLTCGGPFATLARHFLLERYGWLDSVIRFAGEVPLVALARALDRGADWTGIPGITTRHGDGRPAPVCDPLPLELMPRRSSLPEILGYPMAHLAATRGCAGRCAYCGPSALLSLERTEGRASGAEHQVLHQRGVGGVKRRSVTGICDEMARLWHEEGVRYYYFVDEHMLPYDEEQALIFLTELCAGLRRRGVKRWGIGTMLRADRLTPRIVEAFAAAGLVRAFVGLEFASAAEAHRYGRALPDEEDVLALLRQLQAHGVATVTNMLLLHPHSTPQTIAQALDYLGRLPLGTFEATRMMVYYGTRLHRDMEQAGRLTGNPFRYAYTFTDPVLTRFEETFCRLRAEAFKDYSLGFCAHDAALTLALARRLHPAPAAGGTGRGAKWSSTRADLRDLEARLQRVSTRVKQLYLAALRDALRGAQAGAGAHQAQALIQTVAPLARSLRAELEQIALATAARLQRPRRIFAPMRAAAAATMPLVLMGALSCSSRTATVTDAQGTPDLPRTVDAAVHSKEAALPDTAPCPADETARQREAIQTAIAQQAPCFGGKIHFEQDGEPFAELVLTNHMLAVCNTGTMQPLVQAQEQQVAQLVAGTEHHCQVGSFDSSTFPISQELSNMTQALEDHCSGGSPEIISSSRGAMILLDEHGFVQQVVNQPGFSVPPEILDCIRQALAGLIFPCLAGFEICPEHVIIE